MQRITVFQQNGSGESKIAGIRRFSSDRIRLDVVNIDEPLPNVIDDTCDFLPDHLDTDLVLGYLKHPDLSCDLSLLCQKQGIPLVVSRKKIVVGDVITPPICCMLSKNDCLGTYGECFCSPETVYVSPCIYLPGA